MDGDWAEIKKPVKKAKPQVQQMAASGARGGKVK